LIPQYTSEKIDDQDQRFRIADVLQPVGNAAVEEKGIAFVQDEGLFIDLVFDAAFEEIFAFEGIRADHPFAAGLLFQFEQDDIGCL
jgi:hypothetical protein